MSVGPGGSGAYENITTPFRRGDRLFLYTDGITEAHDSDGEEFGRERLRQFLGPIQTNEELPQSLAAKFFAIGVVSLSNPVRVQKQSVAASKRSGYIFVGCIWKRT